MLRQIENLILDMDGVLWHGETPLPDLPHFFARLRRLGIGFVLATNNATKTAIQYTAKLARFGVDISPAQIVTSAEATAVYLRHQYPAETAVYVIGESGLRQALTAQSFTLITPEAIRQGETPPVVVVGYHPQVTYDDLAMGALAIHRGASFIGTNPDPSLPTELGPLPGAGALLAFISTATGIQPTLIGKPGPILFQQALLRLNGTAENTAMVGDRLTTDIAGGLAAGLTSILVLSGISTRAAAETGAIHPDYIFTDIHALVDELEHITAPTPTLL